MSDDGVNEKSMLAELLDCYRHNRCLWDSQDHNYMNREIRNVAYHSLLRIYQTAYPEANIATVKKKLDNMRTAYKRELRKVADAEANATRTIQMHVPKLWYYNNLSFLDEKQMAASVHETLEEECMDSLEAHEESPAPFVPPTPPTLSGPPKKKIRHTIENKKDALIDAVHTLLVTEEKECEVLGRSYALQLAKLAPTQQAIAEKLFSDVIFYGKMKMLTPTATISLSSTTHHDPYVIPQPAYSGASSPANPDRQTPSPPARQVQKNLERFSRYQMPNLFPQDPS